MNLTEIPSPLAWIAGILGTIFLGALGSGFWNLILGPLVSKLGNVVVRISSLGIKSLKDKLYYEASKGHKNHLLKITTFLIFVFIFTPLMYVNQLSERGERHAGYMKKAVEIAKIENIKEEKYDKYVSEKFTEFLLEDTTNATHKLALGSTLLFLFCLFHFFRIFYSESVVKYFDHCIRICSPYFKEKESEQLISDFALMTCKDDFEKITNKLEEVAHRGSVELRDFAPY
ncbi:MAG: hypothetical protein RQ754_06000 [Desulfuromonadales bacterium]|nr:hypothetical protein [Desulfuromonadales bacterium]